MYHRHNFKKGRIIDDKPKKLVYLKNLPKIFVILLHGFLSFISSIFKKNLKCFTLSKIASPYIKFFMKLNFYKKKRVLLPGTPINHFFLAFIKQFYRYVYYYVHYFFHKMVVISALSVFFAVKRLRRQRFKTRKKRSPRHFFVKSQRFYGQYLRLLLLILHAPNFPQGQKARKAFLLEKRMLRVVGKFSCKLPPGPTYRGYASPTNLLHVFYTIRPHFLFVISSLKILVYSQGFGVFLIVKGSGWLPKVSLDFNFNSLQFLLKKLFVTNFVTIASFKGKGNNNRPVKNIFYTHKSKHWFFYCSTVSFTGRFGRVSAYLKSLMLLSIFFRINFSGEQAAGLLHGYSSAKPVRSYMYSYVLVNRWFSGSLSNSFFFNLQRTGGQSACSIKIIQLLNGLTSGFRQLKENYPLNYVLDNQVELHLLYRLAGSHYKKNLIPAIGKNQADTFGQAYRDLFYNAAGAALHFLYSFDFKLFTAGTFFYKRFFSPLMSGTLSKDYFNLNYFAFSANINFSLSIRYTIGAIGVIAPHLSFFFQWLKLLWPYKKSRNIHKGKLVGKLFLDSFLFFNEKFQARVVGDLQNSLCHDETFNLFRGIFQAFFFLEGFIEKQGVSRSIIFSAKIFYYSFVCYAHKINFLYLQGHFYKFFEKTCLTDHTALEIRLNLYDFFVKWAVFLKLIPSLTNYFINGISALAKMVHWSFFFNFNLAISPPFFSTIFILNFRQLLIIGSVLKFFYYLQQEIYQYSNAPALLSRREGPFSLHLVVARSKFSFSFIFFFNTRGAGRWLDQIIRMLLSPVIYNFNRLYTHFYKKSFLLGPVRRRRFKPGVIPFFSFEEVTFRWFFLFFQHFWLNNTSIFSKFLSGTRIFSFDSDHKLLADFGDISSELTDLFFPEKHFNWFFFKYKQGTIRAKMIIRGAMKLRYKTLRNLAADKEFSGGLRDFMLEFLNYNFKKFEEFEENFFLHLDDFEQQAGDAEETVFPFKVISTPKSVHPGPKDLFMSKYLFFEEIVSSYFFSLNLFDSAKKHLFNTRRAVPVTLLKNNCISLLFCFFIYNYSTLVSPFLGRSMKIHTQRSLTGVRHIHIRNIFFYSLRLILCTHNGGGFIEHFTLFSRLIAQNDYHVWYFSIRNIKSLHGRIQGRYDFDKFFAFGKYSRYTYLGLWFGFILPRSHFFTQCSRKFYLVKYSGTISFAQALTGANFLIKLGLTYTYIGDILGSAMGMFYPKSIRSGYFQMLFSGWFTDRIATTSFTRLSQFVYRISYLKFYKISDILYYFYFCIMFRTAAYRKVSRASSYLMHFFIIFERFRFLTNPFSCFYVSTFDLEKYMYFLRMLVFISYGDISFYYKSTVKGIRKMVNRGKRFVGKYRVNLSFYFIQLFSNLVNNGQLRNPPTFSKVYTFLTRTAQPLSLFFEGHGGYKFLNTKIKGPEPAFWKPEPLVKPEPINYKYTKYSFFYTRTFNIQLRNVIFRTERLKFVNFAYLSKLARMESITFLTFYNILHLKPLICFFFVSFFFSF